MLDTNIVSYLIRDPGGRVGDRFARHGDDGVCVSIVTAAELRFGAMKRQSVRLTRRIEEMLSRIDILPFEVPADAVYSELRAKLEAAGRVIGPTDLPIAAHALSMGVTLVTHNLAEFRRVPRLTVESWLE